jgi:hypothetical protein
MPVVRKISKKEPIVTFRVGRLIFLQIDIFHIWMYYRIIIIQIGGFCMAKTFRDFEARTVAETVRWYEQEIYDDHKLYETVTSNDAWHGTDHSSVTDLENLDNVLSRRKNASSRFEFDATNKEEFDEQLKFNIEDAIQDALPDIIRWRFDPEAPKRCKITTVLSADDRVGSGFEFDAATKTVAKRETNAISVVLQKCNTNPYGFDAITAYPELQPGILASRKGDNQIVDRTNEEGHRMRSVIHNIPDITKQKFHFDTDLLYQTPTYQESSPRKKERLEEVCGVSKQSIEKKIKSMSNIQKYMIEDESSNIDISDQKSV